jgi:hypothetical protein
VVSEKDVATEHRIKGPMPMATVRQCPLCELRFSNSNELEDHIARDHDQTEPGKREDGR